MMHAILVHTIDHERVTCITVKINSEVTAIIIVIAMTNVFFDDISACPGDIFSCFTQLCPVPAK